MTTPLHNVLRHLAHHLRRPAASTLLAAICLVIVTVTLTSPLLSTGCTPIEKLLRVNTDSIAIDAEDISTDFSVIVSSSASWMFDIPVADEEWLYVRYADDDPDLLWVTATQRNESLEGRSTKVTISSGDGLTLEIPVTQLAMVARFVVTPSELQPFGAQDTHTQTLTVDTGLTWEALQLHGDWILLTQGTAEDSNGNTLAVGVKRTRISEERSDTIVLRPSNATYHSYADSIVVTQAGAGLVVVSEGFLNEDTFEFSLPTEGGEIAMSVSSIASWRVTTDAAEGSVSFTISESEGDIVNGIRTVMTVAPNLSTEEDNSFSLYFECGGEIYEYRCIQPKQSLPEEPEPEDAI